MKKNFLNVALKWLFAASLAGILTASTRAADSDEPGEVLFNGKDFTGWKMRNEKQAGLWSVVSDVKLNPDNHKQLVAAGKGGDAAGIMFRDGQGDSGGREGTDIVTEKTFGDCQVHVEFMIPEKSNSGVYMMGEYEVQIWSDIGTPKDKLSTHNTGSIYSTKAPPFIALNPYGQWNTFDITFQAPRFDAHGKKIQNAKFIKVVLNGKEIQTDVDTPKPTGSQLHAKEAATGPLMLQGDHGPVAFRNITIQPLNLGK